MTWPDSNDDAPDIIGVGGEEPGLLTRRPWLKKYGIIAGALVAVGAVVMAAVVLPASHPASSTAAVPPSPGLDQPVMISSTMLGRVQADGTFATGAVGGSIWRMAVQDVAGAAGQCQPAVTVNGTDADPLYPGLPRATPVGDPAFMTPGAAMPGVGFAFIKVPADTSWVRLDPASIGGLMLAMAPVTVTSCGERFRLVGFAYPLAGTLRIRASFPAASGSYTAPAARSNPQLSLTVPQVDG